MYLTKSIVIAFISFIFYYQSSAQEPVKSKKEILFISGYSSNSVILLGKTPNTSTSFIKLEFRKETKKEIFGAPVNYQFGLIPFIEFNYPKRDNESRPDLAKGFGISPIGLGIKKSILKKLSYSLYSFGGIILMNKKFPTDEGRKLNYTFSLSADTALEISKFVSISLGYKFHHISNAQTGNENPGIDSNFITISLTLSN